MLRLRRLKIERYRGVTPGTELTFADGINVLLGQNGSGKTTLLDLLARVVGGEFPLAEGETGAVSYTLEVDGAPIEIRAEQWVSWTPRGQRSEIAYEMDAGSRRTRVDRTDRPSHINFTMGFLERFDARFFAFAGRMDEGLDLFRGLFAEQPSTLVVTTEGSTDAIVEFVPAVLVDELLHPSPDREVPFLDRFAALIGAETTRVTFRHARSDEGVLVWRGFDLTVTDGPRVIHQNDLSYGQKCLFTFLYYAACYPEGVLVVDELVNGLHHAWLRACLDELGGRQAFFASQNPLLLDELIFASAEEARQTFVLCSSTRGEDGKRSWTWRKPAPEEADELFASYDVGIRHVSEILKTQGLW